MVSIISNKNNQLHMAKSTIPRSFKLLDELDNIKNYSNVSYGTDDNDLETFTGSIMARNGNIYMVTVYCGESYPTTQPQILFLDSDLYNMPNICESDGSVKESILKKIPWGPTNCFSIGDFLVGLEKFIH